MSDRAYLELWDLTKSYPSRQGEAVIVKNISFKFRKGEFVTIIGHSGCGKSTILMMVAGLSTVTSGGIVLAGKELNGPGPDRGVVADRAPAPRRRGPPTEPPEARRRPGAARRAPRWRRRSTARCAGTSKTAC